jgi:formylglycine-generating enzyme required for sulfatase activity
LPSEAEWEFACRAGSRAPFGFGNEISVDEANFYYDENGTRVGRGCRSKVGNFPPNYFGLHDMHGNVCEWVTDSWHPNYKGAPGDGSPWVDPSNNRRAIRGGAWDYLPRLLRSSWRDWRDSDRRADNIGFRVATSDLKK